MRHACCAKVVCSVGYARRARGVCSVDYARRAWVVCLAYYAQRVDVVRLIDYAHRAKLCRSADYARHAKLVCSVDYARRTRAVCLVDYTLRAKAVCLIDYAHHAQRLCHAIDAHRAQRSLNLHAHMPALLPGHAFQAHSHAVAHRLAVCARQAPARTLAQAVPAAFVRHRCALAACLYARCAQPLGFPCARLTHAWAGQFAHAARAH